VSQPSDAVLVADSMPSLPKHIEQMLEASKDFHLSISLPNGSLTLFADYAFQ
jgi:hypothetical protein